MSASAAKENSTGSLPWYIWALIVPTTVAIIAGIIVSMIPEDPATLYEDARTAIQAAEKEKFKALVTRLEAYEEYATHVDLLNGILAANESRDPLALELFDKAAVNEDLKAEALSRKGNSFAKMGQYKSAIEAFEGSLALEPDNTQTKMMVAQLYFGMGGISHSIALLDDLLESDPENFDAKAVRAKEYRDMLDFEAALSDYSDLLATPGKRAAASPGTIEGYIRCLLELERPEPLKEIYEELGADMPDPILKWEFEVAVGQFDEVKRGIAEAKTARGSGPPMDRLEASIAFIEGDMETASAAIKKAIEMFPRDKRVFELAAKIFAKSGEADWQSACEANVKELAEWQQTVTERMQSIGQDYQDGESRITVAEALLELGYVAEATKWFGVARLVDPDCDAPETSEIYDSIRDMQPLVPMPADGSSTEDGDGNTEASDQATESDSKSGSEESVGNDTESEAATSEKDASESESQSDEAKSDSAKTKADTDPKEADTDGEKLGDNSVN